MRQPSWKSSPSRKRLIPDDSLDLLRVGLGNLAYNALQTARDMVRYGRSSWWWKLRHQLLLHYSVDPPYAVVRRGADSTGLPVDQLIWGETPGRTLESMLQFVGAGPQDVFYDLGCGRGVTVFLAHLLFGTRAVGYEAIGGYIDRARAIAARLQLNESDVAFYHADVLEADLAGGTIYYVTWTTFPEAALQSLSQRLAALPAGTRIIALTHAPGGPEFESLGQRTLPFSWGPSTVHFARVSE